MPATCVSKSLTNTTNRRQTKCDFGPVLTNTTTQLGIVGKLQLLLEDYPIECDGSPHELIKQVVACNKRPDLSEIEPQLTGGVKACLEYVWNAPCASRPTAAEFGVMLAPTWGGQPFKPPSSSIMSFWHMSTIGALLLLMIAVGMMMFNFELKTSLQTFILLAFIAFAGDFLQKVRR